MKAAVFTGIDHIEVRDVPKPCPGENEVLLKVEACAVCGSDIRIFHHGNDRVRVPQIMGHEIAGQVVEVGDKVTKLKIGDRVAVGADIPCGQCPACESGHGNNCEQNFAMGYQFAGGFAEYCLLNEMVMHYGPVHIIPDHVPYEEAALAEPLGCVINGLEMVNIHLGDTVAIIGAGPIGMLMVAVAKLWGATRIIVIDKNRRRAENALTFGADDNICADGDDPVEKVMKMTGGKGADVVLTANTVASTHLQAIDMAGHRARVNLFGGVAVGTTIPLDPNKIHYKEMAVMGSHGSTPRQHKMALDLIASGKIDMKKYITHHFPLDEIKTAFDVTESGRGMKVIIHP